MMLHTKLATLLDTATKTLLDISDDDKQELLYVQAVLTLGSALNENNGDQEGTEEVLSVAVPRTSTSADSAPVTMKLKLI